MRRIALLVLSTLSALVLLFGYSTSTSGPLATSAPIVRRFERRRRPGGSGSSSGSTSGRRPRGRRRSGPRARRTVTGSVAKTQWGPVQVQLTVSSGKITKVTVVQYPNGNGKDQEINDYALPILTQETMDAQSAHRHGQRGDGHQRRLPGVPPERPRPGEL